jgi:hypothetical protein
MRKSAVLICALMALFAVAAVAYGSTKENNQTIKVKLLGAKKAGTKAAPAKVGLNVDLANNGTAPSPAKLVDIFFDKNLVFGGAAFPSCTLAKTTRNQCPANTKVGTGKAAAKAGTSTIALNITAFNGPGGKSLLLALRQVGGPLAINLEPKLTKATGLYGTRLRTIVPKASYNAAPGFYTPLIKFLQDIPGKSIRKSGKTIQFIGLTGCTNGKLQFKTEFTYDKETNAAGQTTKPAPPKSKPTATAACTK